MRLGSHAASAFPLSPAPNLMGVVFKCCFYMRFDFLMDICIRILKHASCVSLVSTVSDVVLLGLHEIGGWAFC